MTTEDEQQATPEGAPASEAPASEAPASEAEAGAPDAPGDEPPGTEVVAATAATPDRTAELEAARRKDEVRNRLVLPLLLPLVSIFVAVLVALNISRLFLAGGDNKTPAVVIVTVLTVAILVGASAFAAARHMRTSTLVLTVSMVLVLVLSAGLVTFGAGEEKKTANGPAAPTGPAVAAVSVDALPSLSFQAKAFTTRAGINEIDYVDKGGSHTLVFADPTLSYFQLAVPQGPTKEKVDLQAGKSYVVYCTIPGHRAAGMQATINVTAGAAAPPAAGASTSTSKPAGP